VDFGGTVCAAPTRSWLVASQANRTVTSLERDQVRTAGGLQNLGRLILTTGGNKQAVRGKGQRSNPGAVTLQSEQGPATGCLPHLGGVINTAAGRPEKEPQSTPPPVTLLQLPCGFSKTWFASANCASTFRNPRQNFKRFTFVSTCFPVINFWNLAGHPIFMQGFQKLA
jgi:hypothetical protein